MRLRRVAALGLAAGLSVPLATPAPAQYAPGSRCEDIGVDSVSSESDLPSRPLQRLGVERAAELLRARGIIPGQGVGVAVIDSGVAPAARSRMDVVAPMAWASGGYDSSHGTTVAGLVGAGPREDGQPVGVAPGARIVDLRVYTQPDDNGSGGIAVERVVEALEWLAGNARAQDVGVAVMAFGVGPDRPVPALERAIRDVVRQDVVVVAASGNRPQDGQARYHELGGEPRPGEDVAGTVYPAAYDDLVVAIAATADGVAPDASEWVLLNSDIDVAVPTMNAVSIGLDGRACMVDEVATSWAAGITAGVVAMLRSAYPDESAAQITARLVATADGNPEIPTRATGAGVLQPVEALTRVLNPGRDGELEPLPHEEPARQQAGVPEAPSDPVAGVLGDARWWGLFGGAGLVLALLLRPLLGGRR